MITLFKIFENNKRIWTAINYDYIDDDFIYLDAWETEEDSEDGEVIAKVNIASSEVKYLDQRAKTDEYAQEAIKDILINILPKLKFDADIKKYNL